MKDINFLKKENVLESLSKNKGSKNLLGNIFVISAVAVVGIYILSVAYDWFLGFRTKSMNKEMDEYSEVVTVQTESTRHKQSINSIKQLIQAVDRGIRYRTDTFKIIADSCPDKVKMTNYDIDKENKWKIKGICIEKEPIAQFAEKLRTSGQFKVVDVRNVGSKFTDDKDKKSITVLEYTFEIELTE